MMNVEEAINHEQWYYAREPGHPLDAANNPITATVLDAARLVANPNIKQIAQRLHNQRIRGVKCYEAFPEECTCMADAEAVVAAALDTDD